MLLIMEKPQKMDKNDTLQEAQPKKYPKACQILWACNKYVDQYTYYFLKQQKGCIFVMRSNNNTKHEPV